MSRIRIGGALLGALGSFYSANAATIRVPADVATIQAAVTQAAANDTVLVAPGIYNEFVVLTGRPIILRGEGNNFAAIIQGPPDKAVLSSILTETRGTVISGFTLRNGLNGLNITSGSSPTFSGNLIASCISYGISVNGGLAVIENNLIEKCGAGLASAEGQPIIRNNTIRNNGGMGISLGERSDAQITQNFIVGNGDVAFSYALNGAPVGPRVTHNTIIGHPSNGTPALKVGGFDSTVVLANNIIMGDPAVELTSFGDTVPPIVTANLIFSPSGRPAIGLDPAIGSKAGNFVANPNFLAANLGDFQLAADSPAIDRADPTYTTMATDITGGARARDGDGNGSVVADLGAYEFETSDGPARPPSRTFSATSFLNWIDFAWGPSDGATNFFIKRAIQPEGPFTEIISTGAMTARDANVVSNTVYYYVISAENKFGRGADSPAIQIRAGIEEGVNDPNTLRVPDQFASIQAAVDSAAAGQTVLVAPGLYNEFVVLKGKAISLRGEGTNYGAVIQPAADKAAITTVNGETPLTRVSGFTIRNCAQGANVERASPSIYGNVFTNCGVGLSLVASGGLFSSNRIVSSSVVGISATQGAPVITDNIIEFCGAGIGSGNGEPLIRNNIIHGNTGQGINLGAASDAQMIQNVIYDNGDAGVAWNLTSAPKGPRLVSNTIIARGSGKPGVALAGFDTTCVVANNIIVGDPAIDLPNVGDQVPPAISFNMLSSPLGQPVMTGIATNLATSANNFAGAPLFLAPAAGDFQLLAESPGIDTGSSALAATATDLLGLIRVVDGDGKNGAVIDAGAYEFVLGPARPPTASFRAQAFAETVEFQWAATDGATRYYLKRATSPAGPYTEILSTPDLSAEDTTAEPNVVYYYTISGENSRGRGADSQPLSIKAGNHPPVPFDDVIEVLEDVPKEFDLTANDVEPDGDVVSLRALAPLAGLTMGVSNIFRYAPPANFSGDLTFQYETADLRGGYATGAVTLRVVAVNDPPLASFQNRSVPANVSTILTPVISDPDSTEFSVLFLQSPLHGSAEATATNILYRPAHGYFGPDSFQAAIYDGVSSSAPVTFNVSVTRPRDLDNDQMADEWENIWDLNNPLADPDRDGFSNQAEYFADTSPRDPFSLLSIAEIQRTPDNHIGIAWAASGGVRYRIWSADQLTGGSPRANFAPVLLAAPNEMENAPNGVSVTRSFVDTRPPSTNGQRFYFLEVVR